MDIRDEIAEYEKLEKLYHSLNQNQPIEVAECQRLYQVFVKYLPPQERQSEVTVDVYYKGLRQLRTQMYDTQRDLATKMVHDLQNLSSYQESPASLRMEAAKLLLATNPDLAPAYIQKLKLSRDQFCEIALNKYKEGGDLKKFIADSGFTDSAIYFGIIKKGYEAQDPNIDIDSLISIFGINDRKQLEELFKIKFKNSLQRDLALHFAEASRTEDPELIQTFLEISLLEGGAEEELLNNRMNPEKRYELLKAIIQQNPERVDRLWHYKLNASQLFELWKIAHSIATEKNQHILSLLDFINSIESREMFYQLMELWVKEDPRAFLDNTYWLKPQSASGDVERKFALLQQALISTPDLPYVLQLENWSFPTTEALVAILMLIAKMNPPMMKHWVQNLMQKYGVNENDRYQIALACAKHPEGNLPEWIEKFDLDEDKNFHLIKTAFENGYDPVHFIYLDRCGVTTPEKLDQIAEWVAQANPEALVRTIEQYPLQDARLRFRLALICAQKDGLDLLFHIDSFKIEDSDQLFELAKLEAKKSFFQGRRRKFISDFHLNTPERLQIISIIHYKMCADLLHENSMWDVIPQENFEGELLSKDHFPKALLDWIFNIAAMLTSPESELQSNIDQQIKTLCEIAEKENFSRETVSRLIENVVPKLANPHQKIGHLIWLADLLIRCKIDPELANFINTPETIPFMQTIFSLNYFPLQKQGLDALFDIYKDPSKARVLLSIYRDQPAHLNLTVILLVAAGVGAESLLTHLHPKFYHSYPLMQLINEFIGDIISEKELRPDQKKKIIQFVLTPPQKGDRESEKVFQTRMSRFREDQKKSIFAFKILLSFKAIQPLQKVNSLSDLIEESDSQIEKICKLKTPSELEKFLKIFVRSQRYPQAMIVYMARLQSLSSKQSVVQALQTVIQAVMNGTFPEIRYNLAINPHLKALFEGKEAVLSAWRTPLSLAQEEEPSVIEPISQNALMIKQMRQALFDKHLDEKAYPFIYQLSDEDWGHSDRIKAILQTRKAELSEVETLCLEIVSPSIPLGEKVSKLIRLQQLFPTQSVFQGDIQAMLQTLASRNPLPKDFRIQDTDEWEDLLLLGTEVNGSCQNILGSATHNRCLVAYMLDGKNRAVVVKDKEGKIIARAVLRILAGDRDEPVLFMERVYMKQYNPALIAAVKRGCMQKAKQMNLPLVASSRDYPEVKSNPAYPGYLRSLGNGQSLPEYVDAMGGIHEDGVFTIPESHLVS